MRIFLKPVVHLAMTLFVLVRCVLGASLCLGFLVTAHAEEARAGFVEKTIRFGLTLRNPLDRPLSNEKLLVYGPATTSNQQVVRLDATQPYDRVTDALGNNLMVFRLPDLAPHAPLKISVTAVVALSLAPPVSTLNSATAYLASEPFIETSHPDIIAASRALGDGLSDQVYVARVYEWLRGHVRYAGFIAEDLGALHALKTRSGDCSEYAYLFAALGRARNIPSKVLGGYVVQSNAVLKAADYHNWNEVYVDGRWQVVDAQKGTLMNRMPDYVVTRIISRGMPQEATGFFHRFSSLTGQLRVEMD